MKCIYCGCEESRVIDSRSTDDGASIRRRRECEGCGRRFTTYEKIDTIPLMVVKKDKRREPFDSEKLRQGIIRACEKRPVSMEAINDLTRAIEMKAYASDQEITSAQLGEMVLQNCYVVEKRKMFSFSLKFRMAIE